MPSGIAPYSAEVLPLGVPDVSHRGWSIDRFVEGTTGRRGTGVPGVFDAHDFVWKHQRAPATC